MTIATEEKKKDIVDALYWDSRVDASDVAVTIDDSQAILTGTVPSFGARRAAEDDAWSVSGIYSIDNQLKVRYPTPAPADEQIRSNIKSMLLWNPDIDSNKVDVLVDNGIVTLKGTVDTYWQRWQAENTTKEVSGVLDVSNELTVVPTESYLDEHIADRIVQAFERNNLINADAVTVKVEKGEVTLTGEVLSWYAHIRAEEIAAATLGVLDVKNLLVVI
jgi:osmotically-inducible protein OsmY